MGTHTADKKQEPQDHANTTLMVHQVIQEQQALEVQMPLDTLGVDIEKLSLIKSFQRILRHQTQLNFNFNQILISYYFNNYLFFNLILI